MPRFEFIALGTLLALAQAVGAPGVNRPTPPPKAGGAPSPGAEPDKPVALASSDLGGLNALLPVGKTARKVVVPSIDEDGVLTSVARMGKITRIDEDQFALENVLLTTFDVEKTDPATGRPEATVVRISKGMYVASEKKLVSDRPVRISKPRLVMTGESLVYWSVEGHAVLKGRTEAVLTDLQPPVPTPDQPPDDPDPEPTPEPEASPR